MTGRRDPANPGVVVGPWAGSTAAPARARRTEPERRGEIPRRYRTDRWGGRALMDCRDCRTPWAPEVEIPHDRLCADCRAARDRETPPLITVDELTKEVP